MDREKLLDRIRRLLRLAESSNVHEAASAAARAQELMARHRIEAAALDASSFEDIRDHRDAPLEQSKRLRPWKTHLADAIARANGCRIYLQTQGSVRAVIIVGRTDDAELVRMLFAELVKRVEAMTRKHGEGRDRAFCNAFRLGMVVTLSERLARAAAETRQKALDSGDVREDEEVEDEDSRAPLAHGGAALAVARLDAHEADVDRFMERELSLRSGRGKCLRADAEGFAMGRIAGHEVELGSRR